MSAGTTMFAEIGEHVLALKTINVVAPPERKPCASTCQQT